MPELAQAPKNRLPSAVPHTFDEALPSADGARATLPQKLLCFPLGGDFGPLQIRFTAHVLGEFLI